MKDKIEQTAGLNNFGQSELMQGLQNTVIDMHAQIMKITQNRKKPEVNLEEVKAEL